MKTERRPTPRPVREIADSLGLDSEDIEPCGWFKGKFAPGTEQRLVDRPRGKYVGVTAISPTPLGEGKTVVAIGLAMALSKLGTSAICTLREPSLGPVFGIKGGGAGGGRATLLPAEDINLHFTGDLHAVSAANNLLAAVLDNHLGRKLDPQIAESTITWRRALDVCDKGLAHIETGIELPARVPRRETGFELTAASEVMAILALSSDLADLRARVGRILAGRTFSGAPVTVEDLRVAGAMTALLRDAIRPNLVQTCEHTPAIVHAGPFANIAHGNSSIIADRIALALADYVVTESGFGADCGAEKFFHLKCRIGELSPDAEVLVCTVRALKYQSGRFDVRPGKPLLPSLEAEDMEALRAGAVNLQAHVEILHRFGVRPVVAVNRFPSDTVRELQFVQDFAMASGAQAAVITDCFANGSDGAIALAEAVQTACRQPPQLRMLYPLEAGLASKFTAVATQVYGADGVDFAPDVEQHLAVFEALGYGNLPVCIAKTQYSLSHDARRLGRPTGFRVPIDRVRVAAGAGFVYGLAGDIVTMPGLPSQPAAQRIDVTADGRITGLH